MSKETNHEKRMEEKLDEVIEKQKVVSRGFQSFLFIELPERLARLEQKTDDLKQSVDENRSSISCLRSDLGELKDKINSFNGKFTTLFITIIGLLVAVLLDLLVRGIGGG